MFASFSPRGFAGAFPPIYVQCGFFSLTYRLFCSTLLESICLAHEAIIQNFKKTSGVLEERVNHGIALSSGKSRG
jgi:hypothetical protein